MTFIKSLAFSISLVFVMWIPLITLADLPSHCLKWQVLGTWDFKMSTLTAHSSPLCGHTQPDDIITVYEQNLSYLNPGFDVVKTGNFTLKSNYSSDAELCLEGSCETATWTMVYDEAMSIRGSQSGLQLLFQFLYVPKRQPMRPSA